MTLSRLQWVLVLPLLLVAFSASAQEYPSKPVRMIVGSVAGGQPDVMARMLGERLSKTLGQPVVVENRPGAGSIAATESVARAAPDGYTLLVAEIGMLAITPALFKNVPFDSLKDFAPITLVAATPLFIAINPTLNINTFPEFVAYAKANPGKLSYGSSGIGTPGHLMMEWLKAEAGIDLQHVPYRGAGQSVPAFMAGDVAVLSSALTGLLPAIQSGKARLLAVTSARRYPTRPEVPTVAEHLPGFQLGSEVGFVAPAGTPPAIIERLATEINKQLKDPDVTKRLEGLGSYAIGTTPAEYAENLRDNIAKYARIVRLSGAKAE